MHPRDEKKHAPIPPIHPHTIAIEKHLSVFVVGQRASWQTLAALGRADLRSQRRAVESRVRSAENRLRNLHSMVFGPYHDAATGERGRVRLSDEDIIDRASHRVGMMSREAKRVQRLAGSADSTKLSPEKATEQAVLMLAARGAQRFTEAKGRECVARVIANSTERIPALETAWKALQGGM